MLYKFVQLLKEGKLQECDEEFQKLPNMNLNWINTNTVQSQQNLVNSKVNQLLLYYTNIIIFFIA